MTKEALLKEEYSKLIANPENVYAQNPSIIKAAHSAMGLYGKSQAIAFGQWATLNDYTYLKSKDYWVNEEEEENNKKYSNDELYNLFLTRQSQQK